jgi:hypothetical protein
VGRRTGQLSGAISYVARASERFFSPNHSATLQLEREPIEHAHAAAASGSAVAAAAAAARTKRHRQVKRAQRQRRTGERLQRAAEARVRGQLPHLLTRRARNALGTATQCTHMNDSPPRARRS